MLSPEKIKEGRELGEKATPRPWTQDKTGEDKDGFATKSVIACVSRGQCLYKENAGGISPPADLNYIEEACNNYIPALDEIERANKILASSKEALEGIIEVGLDKSNDYALILNKVRRALEGDE